MEASQFVALALAQHFALERRAIEVERVVIDRRFLVNQVEAKTD